MNAQFGNSQPATDPQRIAPTRNLFGGNDRSLFGGFGEVPQGQGKQQQKKDLKAVQYQ